MRKKLIAALLISALALVGCADSRTFGGKTYPEYGFANEKEKRSAHVCYDVSTSSVIVAIILSETIIVPIYILGWSLYEPVRMKTSPQDTCGIDEDVK